MALVLAPTAGASPAAGLSVSGWQVYPDSQIVSDPTPATVHGDASEFSYAPGVPAQDNSGWATCGNSAPTRNGQSMCPNSSTIDMHTTSILSQCFTQLNFTYFQSVVNIPAGTNISQFSVNLSGADDGARVSLFNSSYPDGLVIPGSYIQLAGGTGATPNLSPYVVSGSNRVVITQVDDCPTGNNLNTAQIYLNGNVLQSISAAASTTSTTWNKTATFSASGYSGSGAISYSIDQGANGNASDSVCRLSGNTLSASGPGHCYVYAQIAADSSYQTATSTDVEVTFTNPVGADPTLTCTSNASIFNTGYDSATGGTLPLGSPDAGWLVAGPYDVASPALPAPPPSNAAYSQADVYTISAYYEDPAYTSSQYIGSQNGSEGDYYFSYTFNLDPSVSPSTFSLGMDFYADNQVAQVYVNGTPQLSAPQGGTVNDQYAGFVSGNAASTTLGSGWHTGQNTIVVDVLNGGGPFSFDAQMRSSADCSPTAPTITNIPGTGSNPSAVYGGSFTPTVGGTNGDGVKSVTSDTPSTCTATGTDGLTVIFVAAGTCTLTSHVGTGAEYLAADGSQQSFVISPAALTITASSPPDMTYGGSVPSVDPIYSGFVNGDTPSSLKKAPTCDTGATSSSPVGIYPTSCGDASDSNYTISYVDGSLTVDQAPLMITAADAGMSYGGSVPDIQPIYIGFENGDSASSLTIQPTCTTSASSQSPVGSYTSRCSGAVDPNYDIAYDAGTVTVAPVTLTITASSPTMTYGGNLPSVTPSYSGFVNGDGPASLTEAPACVTTATASSPVGNYDTSCSGASDPNYTIVYVDGSVTVTPALLTITASSPTMTYGGNLPSVTPSYSGFVNGDGPASLTEAPACVTTATASSPVGNYDTSCSGASDPNYAITYVDGTLSVTPAPLSITASSPTMTYAAGVPSIVPSYSGFVNGDTAASLTTQPTCGTSASSSSQPGVYATYCAGAIDANYSITYVGGALDLLLVAACPNSASYGTGKDLVGANFSGENLTGRSFVGDDLTGANFQGVNLKGADFTGADLQGADLKGTNLGGALLKGANLYGSNLQGANMSGDDVSCADLQGAHLDGVNLKGANLFGDNLDGASLQGVNLEGADLGQATLVSAALKGTNLKNGDLTSADTTGAVLTGANTNGVNWSGATCPDGSSSSSHRGSCQGTF